MVTLLEFNWHELLNPAFYIENGGLWLFLFIVFAETGMFAGFFLPGDSLLFVAGIYSNDLIMQGVLIPILMQPWVSLLHGLLVGTLCWNMPLVRQPLVLAGVVTW